MTDMQWQYWMTEELEAELKMIARDGVITCEQVQAFAQRHAIEITKMKPFVDCIGLQVANCRGLCA